MNNIYHFPNNNAYSHKTELFDQDAKGFNLDNLDVSGLHQDQELSAKINQAEHFLSLPADFTAEAEDDYEQLCNRPCRADNLYDLAEEYRQDDEHQKKIIRRGLVVAAALGSIFLSIATLLDWDLRDPAFTYEEQKAELYHDYTDETGNVDYGQHFLDNATPAQIEESKWLLDNAVEDQTNDGN